MVTVALRCDVRSGGVTVEDVRIEDIRILDAVTLEEARVVADALARRLGRRAGGRS